MVGKKIENSKLDKVLKKEIIFDVTVGVWGEFCLGDGEQFSNVDFNDEDCNCFIKLELIDGVYYKTYIANPNNEYVIEAKKYSLEEYLKKNDQSDEMWYNIYRKAITTKHTKESIIQGIRDYNKGSQYLSISSNTETLEIDDMGLWYLGLFGNGEEIENVDYEKHSKFKELENYFLPNHSVV